MKLSSDMTVRYWVAEGEEAIGPYTLEGLESLVYLGKITPDTLVCLEGTETYSAIRDLEIVARLYPRLQETPMPKAWGRPGEADRHDVKEFKFGEVKFDKLNDSDRGGKIEVTDLLHEVRQAERDAGQDFLEGGKTRVSKRSVDFWIMLILGNAVLYVGAYFLANTTSWVFAIAGSGLYTFGLIWSMFGVMNRY